MSGTARTIIIIRWEQRNSMRQVGRCGDRWVWRQQRRCGSCYNGAAARGRTTTGTTTQQPPPPPAVATSISSSMMFSAAARNCYERRRLLLTAGTLVNSSIKPLLSPHSNLRCLSSITKETSTSTKTTTTTTTTTTTRSVDQSRHNKNNNKNNNNNNNNNNDFVRSWLSIKDQLITMELGSLESHHWEQARKLIDTLRRHREFVHDNSKRRVEHIFSVLDRLCGEVEFSSKRKTEQGLVVTAEARAIPLPLRGETLGNALLAWRDHVFSLSPKKTSSHRKALALKKRQYDDDNHNNKQQPPRSPMMLLGDNLSIESTHRRVERYVDSGLFQAHPAQLNIILRVLRHVKEPQQATKYADATLNRMLEKARHNPLDTLHHPNKVTMGEIIETWAHSWLPESPKKVDQYLQMLQGWHKQTSRHRTDMRPDAFIFCSAMEVHGHYNESTASFLRIQELFAEMKKTCCDGDLNELGTIAYNRACHALASCRHPKSPDAARKILDDMLCHQSLGQGHDRLKPSEHSFNIVLAAYARAGRTKEATALFEFMEQLAEKTGDASFSPGIFTYRTLIWAYARAGDTKRAESLLLNAIEEKGYGMDKPMMDGLLVSFAQAGGDAAAETVANIITVLHQQQQKQKQQSKEQHIPDTVSTSTYNKLLSCYSAMKDGTKGAVLAEELFQWMEGQSDENLKPNGESWKSLIYAWRNAGEPHQAEQRLRKLCELSKNDKKGIFAITPPLFGMVMEAWGKSNHPDNAQRASAVMNLMKEFGLQPDVSQYTTLMSVWAGSKSTDPGEPVERVFREMVEQWKQKGNQFAKPSEKTFTVFLLGLSRSTNLDFIKRAEEYLQEMGDEFGVSCNSFHFNTVMSGWARHSRPERVEELFQKQVQRYKEQGDMSLKPNSFTHTTRLQSWSKNGNPEMTSKALNEWIADCEAGSMDNIPKTDAFNAVLSAWLRSKHPDAGEKAETGLRQMFEFASSKRFDCYPDIITFTTVISAYAESGSKISGIKATELLNEVKRLASLDNNSNNLQPNVATYAEAIRGLVNNSDDDDPNARAHVLELIQEIKSKPAKFWHLLDPVIGHQTLKKIKSCIHSSSFHGKAELLDELRIIGLASKKAFTS